MSIRDEVRQVGSYSFTAHDAEVKLDQNESPWPLPEPVEERFLALLQEVPLNRYPDLQAYRLRRALARRHDWDEAGVTVAGGSNVLIQSLVIAAGIGRTVLTVSPTFSVYALQARLMAHRLVEVPLLPGFGLDVPALRQQLSAGSGVLFLASPAAPTGNLHGREELEELIAAAGSDWLVVLDEAYQQFADQDLTGLARQQGVVVLRTFSKAAGLAGLRLGYALSSPEVGVELQKIVIPFSVSSLQERLALAVLDNQPELDRRVAATVSERALLQQGLAGIDGVHAWQSDANFILFRVADAAAVHAALLEDGVLVRRQDHLPGLDGCLRVSVGLPSENSLFLRSLTAIMGNTQAQGVAE